VNLLSEVRPSKEEIKKLVEQTVAIIGDKWSLLIIGELEFGKSPNRFNGLMRELRPISSRTLSIKLAKLSDHGIVKKAFEDASPPYTQYSLTEKGKDLCNALKAMADWNLKWCSDHER
jgi:DNA-binding HxlR family transcriptional regulator